MTNLKWVDVTKGIGILLVLLGHNNFGSLSKTIIYTFHMPLFFFINGYLFHYVKYKQNVHGFIYRKLKRLVVPYFITNIFILCTFTLLHFLKLYPSFNDNSPVENLIGVLYGNVPSSNTSTVFTNSIDISSWFLLSLFCASLLLYIIAYSHEKYGLPASIILSSLFILFGFGISKYIFIPWGLDIACVSIIFMFSGYLINYYKISWPYDKSKSLYYILIYILLLSIVISINGYVDMSLRIYSNLVLFGIGGLLGTYVIIEFAKKICINESVLIRLLTFLGKNSLIIFIFQLFTPPIFINFINILVPIKEIVYSSPVLCTLNMLVFTIITVVIIKNLTFLNNIYY
jgi:acyltransferase